MFVYAQYETADGLAIATLSGRAKDIKPGDCIQAVGTWVERTYKGASETIFRARSITPDLPKTAEGAELFLRLMLNERTHGVTTSRIKDFIEQHGATAFASVMERPSVLLDLSNNPRQFQKAILETWSSNTQGNQAMIMLEGAKLPPRAIQRIMAEYSSAALPMLKKNPYAVAHLSDVGFKNADLIGKHLGVSPDNYNRLTAAVGEVLRKEASKGSTSADVPTMLAGMTSISGIDERLLLDFLYAASRKSDHDLAFFLSKSGQPYVALNRYYLAEVDIQNAVQRLVKSGRRNEPTHAAAVVGALFAAPAFARFDAVQRTAVEMASTEPLSIITGGPGTGKSTVMDAVSQLCDKLDGTGHLFLAAPSGKAAKRLGQTTNRQSTTVHRLLGAQGENNGAPKFRFNLANPLPNGCVVVVDEASMIDAEVAAALFNAMPADGRVILVGDRNQLPSVGAGSVFADLLSAEVNGRRLVPSVELVNVYRQSKDSGIAKGAALIREGLIPEMTEEDTAGVSMRDLDADSMVREILALVCEELPKDGYDPIKDIAVLCPQSGGTGGTWELNTALSRRLNRSGASIPGVFASPTDDPLMPVPRSGDRVMLTENDADNDVMNGDIGIITTYGVDDKRRPTFTVAFDSGQKVVYPAVKWRSLILAYAGTIHKSQGSQYPVVVMAISRSHKHMLDRALTYTAWTRAQNKLVVMGNREAVNYSIRTYKGDDRATMLRMFLGELREDVFGNTIDWQARAKDAQKASGQKEPTQKEMPPARPASRGNSLFAPLRRAVEPPARPHHVVATRPPQNTDASNGKVASRLFSMPTVLGTQPTASDTPSVGVDAPVEDLPPRHPVSSLFGTPLVRHKPVRQPPPPPPPPARPSPPRMGSLFDLPPRVLLSEATEDNVAAPAFK